jgi:hypothetical protein
MHQKWGTVHVNAAGKIRPGNRGELTHDGIHAADGLKLKT